MKKKKLKKSLKRVFSETLRKHIKFLLAVIVLSVLVLCAIFVRSLFMKSDIVSREELKDYIEEYLSEYFRLVNENMYLIGLNESAWSNFVFFWSYPKEIEGVISLTHGAAVFFNSSERKEVEITIREFPEPIEYYVWPEMIKNTTDLPIVRILKAGGYYHLDSQVSYSYGLLYVEPGANLRYTGEGKAFNISGKGAIVIFGSLIHDHGMILKGTNSKEDWSKLEARFDALSEFIWDCEGVLNATTIQSVEAKYKLPLLLERMSYRMESGSYKRNSHLFRDDYEELKEINPSNETLSKVLTDYYEMQKSASPTLPELFSDFWNTYMAPLLAILGLFPLILAMFWYFKVPHIKMEYDSTLVTELKSPSGRKYKATLIIMNQGDEIEITRFRVLVERQEGIGIFSGDWEIGSVKLEAKYRPLNFKGREFSVYEADVYATIDRNMENAFYIAKPVSSEKPISEMEKYLIVSCRYRRVRGFFEVLGLHYRTKDYVFRF